MRLRAHEDPLREVNRLDCYMAEERDQASRSNHMGFGFQSLRGYGFRVYLKIKGPDNPTCVFFRKSVAVDTIGSLSKGTSECASVSQ